jgi:hypothetical protein
MNRIFCIVRPLLLAAVGAGVLSAQTGLAGRWEGNLKLPDREMAISIDLARNEKGEWACNFGVVAQGVTGLRCENVAVAGNTAKFAVPEAPGVPEIEAALREDGTLAGRLSVQGNNFEFSLKRMGEAKIVAAASPAVDKRFEGGWEGRLETPGGALRIVINIQNQADNTVKATLDSPDQNAAGLAMSDIVQKESAIEMKLRVAGGAFKGALNKEGTEIAGEWSQGGASLPLVLKKAAAK